LVLQERLSAMPRKIGIRFKPIIVDMDTEKEVKDNEADVQRLIDTSLHAIHASLLETSVLDSPVTQSTLSRILSNAIVLSSDNKKIIDETFDGLFKVVKMFREMLAEGFTEVDILKDQRRIVSDADSWKENKSGLS